MNINHQQIQKHKGKTKLIKLISRFFQKSAWMDGAHRDQEARQPG